MHSTHASICTFPQRLFLILENVGKETRRCPRGSLLCCKIHMENAKMLAVTIVPLKVVGQRPGMVACQRHL